MMEELSDMSEDDINDIVANDVDSIDNEERHEGDIDIRSLINDLRLLEPNDKEFDYLILVYAFKYGLSNSAISTLLDLLQYAMPSKPFTTSLYRLHNHFNTNNDYSRHYYCNHCCSPLLTRNDMCVNAQCPGWVRTNAGMFANFGLQTVMRRMLARPQFAKLRAYKTDRVKHFPTNVEDIMDGSKWVESAELYNDSNNIVFGLSTDGIPLFKSSKKSMWAIWMVFYDLPPNERYKHHNMALIGISFGSRPIMNRFLGPVVDDIMKIRVHPITIPGVVKGYTIYCLNVSADLPAKTVVRTTMVNTAVRIV
eukprot:Pompholyxophrys_sp_v1_NODE_62_length_2619_cov_2.184405.p1 type:complete len:309 gc:universal NODE_62_length_2619_cov_2.184405:1112-186(-)